MRSIASRRAPIALIVALPLVAAALAPTEAAVTATPERPPNVIVIVTDDMRVDEIAHLPAISALAARGTSFDRAFVTVPLCCPSRATILTGRLAPRTRVWNNLNLGGWARFTNDERSTIATWLRPGYETALVGKYLNGYRGARVQGWDRWVAFLGNGAYYDYRLRVDGRWEEHGRRPRDYSTRALRQHALRFIHRADGPFFLYFAPKAPHAARRDPRGRWVPAPRDRDAPVSVSLPPNVNEVDVSDKPAYIQAKGRSGIWEGVARKRVRTLLSVDRAVSRIVGAVEARGELDDTVFVFTSDNGMQVGSHRWMGKAVPYEESIRVPMIWVWGDRWSGTDDHLVTNADIAPTIAELAGVHPTRLPDGSSLVPLLEGVDPPWRSSIPLAGVHQRAFDDGGTAPTFCGIRTADELKYVRYTTGEEELYDLTSDPHEMENLVQDPEWAVVLDSLRVRAAEDCALVPATFP